MNKVYITGLGNVSPQRTHDHAHFLDEITAVEATHVKVQDPGYKEYISGDILRRMGRITRMGVASAMIALRDAGCSMPDAIITGTGLGCIEDTEKFLNSMIRNKEEFLTPTSFIQSTHNTVGAQIALLLKCHQYNFTYVHRGISFESAMLDTLLRLSSGQAETVLLGGLDEITANTLEILQRLGQIRRKPVLNLKVLSDPARGAIAGEGSAFFVVSSRAGTKDYGTIREVRTLFYPSVQEIGSLIGEITGGTKPDAVILGVSGDPENDRLYKPFRDGIFHDLPQLYYKHLCGEYHTAPAFSLWLAAKILRTQQVPEITLLNGLRISGIRNILLYNHYRNINHSFILVSRS